MLWPSLLAISGLLLLGKLKLHYTRSLSKPLVLKEWLFQRKLSLVGLVLGVHDSEVHSKHWNYPEDIKKKWQEYTEELYRKDLNDPDNHDGMITHLEPDILESKVKWTLGGINMNKATGGDGIPTELFQILKDMLWKCCTQYARKLGKLHNGHRTGKCEFSFQSQMFKLPHNCTHLMP